MCQMIRGHNVKDFGFCCFRQGFLVVVGVVYEGSSFCFLVTSDVSITSIILDRRLSFVLVLSCGTCILSPRKRTALCEKGPLLHPESGGGWTVC